VSKDASVLLDPSSAAAAASSSAPARPGSPAAARAAAAVAAQRTKAAAAAAAPASRSLSSSSSRARESPGLAILAAGAIVWSLLGPMGGAFVKFAQHPAADKRVRARARRGAPGAGTAPLPLRGPGFAGGLLCPCLDAPLGAPH
jgi:hypothetical protein